MNFAPDPLDVTAAPAPSRRPDQPPGRVHYTNEFHIYEKPRPHGSGSTKRARCNHCQGDWAYNETRLKHHIIDPFRGCRRIPPESRERVRLAANATAVVSAPRGAPSNPLDATQTQTQTQQQQQQQQGSHPAALPPPKRKREPTTLPVTAPLQSQTVAVAVPTAEPHLPVQLAATTADPHGAQVHVAVEFSMASGTLMRATWIAAELISEFHRDVVQVGLIPRNSENTFNIWIGGKIAWSRGIGQPLPDYDHLRPIVRAQCCNAAL